MTSFRDYYYQQLLLEKMDLKQAMEIFGFTSNDLTPSNIKKTI